MAQVYHGDVVKRRLVDAWVVVLSPYEGERDLLEATYYAFRLEFVGDSQGPAAFRPGPAPDTANKTVILQRKLPVLLSRLVAEAVGNLWRFTKHHQRQHAMAVHHACTPVDDVFSAVGQDYRMPADTIVLVVVDVKPVAPSFKDLFKRALGVLVNAHAGAVGVVLQVFQLLGHRQRWVFVEGQAEQTVSGMPGGVLKHRALAIRSIPVLILRRLVVRVDVRQPINYPVLARADVANGRPAVQHCRVFRPLEGDVVAHRAYPILIAVTGLMIGYSRWMK